MESDVRSHVSISFGHIKKGLELTIWEPPTSNVRIFTFSVKLQHYTASTRSSEIALPVNIARYSDS